MLVVFDLLCSQPSEGIMFHGGGEYTKQCFKLFVNNCPKEQKIAVCYDKDTFLDDWILKLLEERHIEVIDVKHPSEIVKYLNGLKEEVRFFAGMIYRYKNVVFNDNVFSIGTYHGLRAIEKPVDKYELLYFNFLKSKPKNCLQELTKFYCRRYAMRRYFKSARECLTSFKCVLTDSNHSAYSLKLNLPDIMKDKDIQVIYPITQDKTVFKDIKSWDGKYIMLISADRWVKNSYRAVRAIDALYTKGMLNGIKTRVYGNLPKKIRRKIKNKDNFELFGYVSTDELEKAYAGCEVFCYPTLNEGFGNVPMEVMKYGKTCVVSAVCSLPEVYGDAVIYVNPYDEMEIQNRILQAVDHKISSEVLNKRLEYIYKRQNTDAKLLCRLISGEEQR